MLRPGAFSIHDGWTLHASPPNRSADRRIGFNMNVVRPQVRQAAFAGDTATLLRGEDRHGCWLPEPLAEVDYGTEGIASRPRSPPSAASRSTSTAAECCKAVREKR